MEDFAYPDAQPSAGAEGAASAPRDSSPDSRAIGVLVVDDDDLVRALLRAALGQHQFAVHSAADGEEALQVYQRHGRDIDVVLLDVRMPRLDGPHTLAALERINPKVCCCFMTGDLGNYTEGELLQMHAARVFRKPFLTDDLAVSIRQLVQQDSGRPAGLD
jgi:DNA-binding NtrC family response regulator